MQKLMSLILLTTFIITGCVQKTGTQQLSSLSQTTLDEMIQDGVTTKHEVLDLLGVCYEVVDAAEEKWVYTLTERRAKSMNFIPLINLFYHGARSKTKVVTIVFDKNQVVCYHEFIEQQETKTAGVIPYLF